jgi:hypothetical protein
LLIAPITPMAKKDQLAPLILSLTPAEKKYFVQFTSIRSDDKSYMKLFDCVLRDGVFNADKLCKELKKTKANLAHEKEYLVECIMKALRNFHDDLPEVAMNNRVSDVAILIEKKLYHSAELETRKAQKEAEKHARFELHWKLLSDEKFILIRLLPLTDSQKQWGEVNRAMSRELQNMQYFTDFYHLGLAIQESYFKHPVVTSPQVKASVEKLVAHPLFKKKFTHPYFRFQQHYLITYLYHPLKRTKEALNHSRKALQLIETYPHQIQANVLLYTGCVNTYLLGLSGNRQFDEYLAYLDKLKNRYYHALPFNHYYLDQRYDAYHFYYMFEYYMHQRNSAARHHTDIQILMKDFEQKAGEIRKQFNDAQWLQMQRNAVNLYFYFLNDDSAALRWAGSAINQAGASIANPILSLIKTTAVLIHTQLKNDAILPGLLQSAARQLKKLGLYTVVEQETFSFIASLPKLHTARERKTAFKKLKERYAYLQQTTPESKRSFNRIFYELWVERNLQ